MTRRAEEPAEWYQKSASKGSPDGEFALGRCYEFGIGVPQDRGLAIQWFQKAAAQGNSQAAYFAKWLKEPTNFIGFRNNTEHNYVMDRLHFAGDFLGRLLFLPLLRGRPPEAPQPLGDHH